MPIFNVLSALAASAAVASAQPEPIDIVSWFSSNDYPAEALKDGIEGTVRFQVNVDATGMPVDCRIIGSSGSAILDKATCEIVRKKGRFQPAKGPDGRPVAGVFASATSWRNPAKGSFAYQATILEFVDAAPPKCSVQFNLRPGLAMGCDQLLAQADFIKDLSERYRRVAFLFASSDGAETPYRGESGWGDRLSLLASEQFYLKGSYPVACVSVAAEGWDAGRDACAGMPGNRKLTPAEQRQARKVRVEASVYGVSR